jgi:hypothetical protein
MTHRYTKTHGLAAIRWLLTEWDCTGHPESWFSELLRKYNDRAERVLAWRATH